MKRYTLFILILFSLLACEKPEKVSDVPSLEFRKLTFTPGIDNPEIGNPALITELELWVQDGNADIYSLTSDSSITSGIYIKYLQKVAGEYSLLEFEDTLSYFRIQHNPNDPRYQRIFEPQKLNKTLEGTLFIDLFFNENEVDRYDTIKMEIYLEDREGNQSNVVSTPDLPFEFEEFTTE